MQGYDALDYEDTPDSVGRASRRGGMQVKLSQN